MCKFISISFGKMPLSKPYSYLNANDVVLSPGTYVYVDSTEGPPGTTYMMSTLDLSTISPAPYMVSFWYHSFGSDMSRLNVYEVKANGVTPLWTQTPGSNIGKVDIYNT